jgi:sulfopyruvate decarboxylase TPP-binding subunit
MSTSVAQPAEDVAGRLARTLLAGRSGPFLGTPCGVLAPLYRELDAACGVRTIAREDSAVGVAAGAALAGQQPVVLMQNSGFGQSVNAFASLVMPCRLDVVTVISVRGIAPDNTEENSAMGTLTPAILAGLRADVRSLAEGADLTEATAGWLAAEADEPRFLLIAPGLFGWRP